MWSFVDTLTAAASSAVRPIESRIAFALWSLAWSSTLGYRVSTRLGRIGARLGGIAGPGRVWAQGRALPSLGRRYRDGR